MMVTCTAMIGLFCLTDPSAVAKDLGDQHGPGRSNAAFAYGYKVEAFSSDLLGTFERNAFTRTCKDAACVYTTTTHAVR
ncbi:MAG: hypothetical protein ACYDD1_14250, partial [Caulobacteraceae bacterium]